MTKEQFDRQRWHKGMKIRITGCPDSAYKVEGVDFDAGSVSYFDGNGNVREAHHSMVEIMEG